MGIFSKLPRACPFLRHQPGSGKSCCTVHLTRPEICRNYGCWRLLILNHRGRPVGKITYIRTLSSEDPVLTNTWETCIEEIREPDDRIWEDEMIRILIKAGYTERK